MSDESYRESNNTNGKRTLFLLIFIIVVAVAFSWPAIIALEEAITDEGPGEGLVTYNASRYFFRFDHPEDWQTEKQQYGFLMNEETGLVVTLTPAVKTENPAGGDGITVRHDAVKISFYYNIPEGMDLKNADLDRVMDYYQDRLRSGLLGKDTGIIQMDSFVDKVNVESEKTELYSVDFRAMRDGESVYGTLYCAKRARNVCAVVLTYTSIAEFETFREEVFDVVRSFRLTVFDD